jgi:hypothetical protein
MKHLLKKISLSGGKGKKPKAKPATLTPPQIGDMQMASSYSYAEVLDLISDGPIEGLVNQNGLVLKDENILQGIYLDDTVIAVSNDLIAQSQAEYLSGDIKNNTFLNTFRRFFQNIQNADISTSAPYGYKVINIVGYKVNENAKITLNDSAFTKFNSILIGGTDLNIQYDVYDLENSTNVVNYYDRSLDRTVSDNIRYTSVYYDNFIGRLSVINSLMSIYDSLSTNKYEKEYLDNMFSKYFGINWKSLDRNSLMRNWAYDNVKSSNMQYLIYANDLNLNITSNISLIDSEQKINQYKFRIEDDSGNGLVDKNESVKVFDFILPRIGSDGKTTGKSIGFLLLDISAILKITASSEKIRVGYWNSYKVFTVSNTFSIPISVINSLSNATVINLKKITQASSSSANVQKYNYSNILAEYRSGKEFQNPFRFFNNILIDKNYSAELLGPFITSAPIQRILENYEIVSKVNREFTINPTTVGGSIIEGSADDGTARNSKYNYSDWNKTQAAFNELASPIKHIINNPNVLSVFITIQIDSLSDTLSKDISSARGVVGTMNAGTKYPSIINIEIETGSINSQGIESVSSVRKFSILALIESPTLIDIGNPDGANFSSYSLDFVKEYNPAVDNNIFSPFILPNVENSISALDIPSKRYVKITKLSTETNSVLINKNISLNKITEIIPLNLSYPHSAIVATKIDSRSFGNMPTRSFDCKLKKIKVPSNYNPLLKNGKDKRYYSTESEFNLTNINDKLIYDGDWDGTFKDTLEWTDNPAWILYDLITNERYGLGQYIDTSQIDIFDLYKIARFCDAVDDFGYFQGVPDNAGGLEPRFSCNIMFNEGMKVFDALNTVAALFRGVIYYNNSQINFVDDRPKDTIALFANTNVKDGVFNYTNYRRDEQFNSIEVVYIDRFENFLTKVEYIEDEEDIRKRGIFKKTINANGVTSRAMARRLGQHLIFQTIKENQSVSFTSGLESLLCKPGDLIIVEDELKSLKSNFGKVLSVNPLAGSIRLNEQFVSNEFNNKLTVYTPTGYSTYDEILELAESLRSRVNSTGFHLTQGGLGSKYDAHTGFYEFSGYINGFGEDKTIDSSVLRSQYAFYTGSNSKFCYFSTLFTGWVLSTGFAFSNNNTYDKFIFNSGDHDFVSVNRGSGFNYNSAVSSGRGTRFVASANIIGGNSTFRDISGLELQMTKGLLDKDISLFSPSQITTFDITGITQYEYGCEAFVSKQDINYSLISFVKQGSVYRFQRKLADDQIYKVISIKEENPNEYSLICTKFDTGKYALIENDKSIQNQSNTLSYTLNQKIGNVTYSVLNSPVISSLVTGTDSNGFYISGNWKPVSNALGYNVRLYQPNGNTQEQILNGINETGTAFYTEGIGNYSYRVNASGSYSNGTAKPNTYFDSDYSVSGLFLIYDGSLMNYDRPYLSSVTIL